MRAFCHPKCDGCSKITCLGRACYQKNAFVAAKLDDRGEQFNTKAVQYAAKLPAWASILPENAFVAAKLSDLGEQFDNQKAQVTTKLRVYGEHVTKKMCLLPRN